jgi:hypothetical protein
MKNNEIQFILYSMPDDEGKVQVVIKDETLWCTQKAMAQLFGVGVPAISKHLKNVFEEGELDKEVVVSKMEITTQHGAMVDKSQTHNVDFYHLDAIIAVGYRVNSAKATKFRQWATKILSEYIKKGFAMDDERLKQGTPSTCRSSRQASTSSSPSAAIRYCPTKEKYPQPRQRRKPRRNMTFSTAPSASTLTLTKRSEGF